jgi:hypothetical protein
MYTNGSQDGELPNTLEISSLLLVSQLLQLLFLQMAFGGALSQLQLHECNLATKT